MFNNCALANFPSASDSSQQMNSEYDFKILYDRINVLLEFLQYWKL
ncbi:hypothetical protein Plhal304r1_c066g0154441 [Plasmopara halstedii]